MISSVKNDKVSITSSDLKILENAVELLLSPTLTSRISKIVGKPIDKILTYLPDGAENQIQDIVKAAVNKAADVALWSLENKTQEASPRWNKAYSAISGGVGGFFGLTGLTIELPISTTIMMRAVADIARSEGFNLEENDTKQSCIEVFALGGERNDDDESETTYYAMRLTTSELIKRNASKWFTALLEKVSARFGVVVTEKVAAQAVPVIGAAGGALINTMFTDFYQDIARGHFSVKKLEKKYGFDVVRHEFDKISLCKGYIR